MAEPVDILLGVDALVGLGSLLPGTKNRLSPFATPRQLASFEATDLTERGLLSRSGAPTPAISSTLLALANPKAYVQLRLQSGKLFLEHTFYHGNDGRLVMLTASGGRLAINNPAPVEEVLEGIRQLMGGSILKGLDFRAELGRPEALALAALIDLRRRAALRSLVEGNEGGSQFFDVPSISSAATRTEDSTQWLASLLNLVGPPAGHEDLARSLGRLVEQGHAAREGQGYRLEGGAALVGSRLLVIEQVLLWGAGRLAPDGSVVRVDQLCLQGGVSDVLAIETTERGLLFEGVSPAQVVEYLRYFLADSEAVPVPQALSGSGVVCQGCQATVSPGNSYCPRCGAQLKTARSTCPSCGQPTEPNQRFCGNCGAGLALSQRR